MIVYTTKTHVNKSLAMQAEWNICQVYSRLYTNLTWTFSYHRHRDSTLTNIEVSYSCYLKLYFVQYIFNYFNHICFHSRPSHKQYFLSCRPFVVNAAFSTGLVVPSVSWLGQLTEQETEEITRIVENFALTTKGLQERKYNL